MACIRSVRFLLGFVVVATCARTCCSHLCGAVPQVRWWHSPFCQGDVVSWSSLPRRSAMQEVRSNQVLERTASGSLRAPTASAQRQRLGSIATPMKPLAVLLMGLVAAAPATADYNNEVSISSCFRNGSSKPMLHFRFVEGPNDRWDPTAAQSPPLAPGKAVAIAKSIAQGHPPGGRLRGWELDSIQLRSVANRSWFYVVQFSAQLPNDGGPPWNGPVPLCEVLVRLDGTAPRSLE